MDAFEFKQQFVPCHRKLYRVAFMLTGNDMDAEDLVQEAYLKLWNKRDQLTYIRNTEAYCVTLIKHLYYDNMRIARLKTDGHVPEELNLPTDSDPIRDVEQKEEANLVMRLISKLPESQKQVIELRDVKGCSYEEIGHITCLSGVNIRVLLSRARKKIRERYNEINKYESR